MKIVRIGNEYINMDRIISAHYQKSSAIPQLHLGLPGGVVTIKEDSPFNRNKVAAIVLWLNNNSELLTIPALSPPSKHTKPKKKTGATT